MTRSPKPPEYLKAADLTDQGAVIHGFFGRRGGVSTGCYGSLNCGLGSDDKPEHVAENRARVMTALGLPATALRTVYQVHGCAVVTVDGTRAWGPAPPRADALVTATPGVALGILTADCVPVLFADPGAGVVGAAHAGWKGAHLGVTEVTVEGMVALGARRSAITAVLGPAIGYDSYEVGADFPDPFQARDTWSAEYFRPSTRAGHHLFDLAGYLADRLRRAGIGAVARIRADTCADEDRFFSYRRATKRGEPDYGRELSVIALPG